MRRPGTYSRILTLSPWHRFLHWLHDVPISDPVDRRNAPAMQVLFLFMGIATPVLWGYHVAFVGMPTGGTLAMVMSLTLAMTELFAVRMIRLGHFRSAVRLYLVTALIAMLADYLLGGFKAMSTRQIDPFMTLVISGLVLGRRSLWLVFATLQLIIAAGFAVDLLRAAEVDASFANLLSVVASQLVLALILDRAVNAMRETLAESEGHRRDLQREMQARERAQSQLIHAQKLEATGRLASGIAHDFGNILHVITGYASQRDRILDIERRDEQEAAIDKTLSNIGGAAERGTAITRKLLSFSRHDMTRPQVFDAVQAVAGMQPMLRQLFPHAVSLELPEAAAPLPIRFDRSEFELMIINIASNARDAMPEGGRFRIDLSRNAAGTARIVLSDTGHGMDAGVQAQIFEPFFSTKTAVGGTGLGLAVIRDIVLASGGDITVESSPGQGSSFCITLPSAEMS